MTTKTSDEIETVATTTTNEDTTPETPELAAPETMAAATTEVSTETTDDTDEVIVTIGDDPPPQDEVEAEAERAPTWVKELRKNYRELQRKNRELEDKLKVSSQPAPPTVPVLGKKPELADFKYDTDEYEIAVAEWFEQKRVVDAAQAEADAKAKRLQDAWAERLQFYDKTKKELKVANYDEAEAAVQAMFDITQQGIIVKIADNPALVFHALGTFEKEAKELSAIKDPQLFIKAVARLETKLKVHNRKKPPQPELSTVRGNGRVSGAVDATLERLREEAARTGDTSKVVAYKRQKKLAAK